MAIFRNNRLPVLLAGMALACAMPARASSPADAQASDRRALHERVAALKLAALEELRGYLAQDLASDYPAHSRLTIYLNVEIPNFVLERAELRIDGRKLVSRDYSPSEQEALLLGTADRLLRANIEPGSHTLRIDYHGHRRAQDQKLAGHIDLEFDSSPGHPQAFILPVVQEALLPEKSFFGKSRPKGWRWEQDARDPRLGLVRFLRQIGQPFAGTLELLAITAPEDNPHTLPYGYYPLLAHSYVDFGMRRQAVAAAKRAAGGDTNAAALSALWLRVAELDYEQGEHHRAVEVLEGLEPDTLPPEQRLTWLHLKSRALLALGDPTAAADLLDRANRMLDSRPALAGSTETRLLLRYNYGVALIKSGETERGAALLDRLGDNQGRNEASHRLREQANLTLGYHFLRQGETASAKPIFQRLSLTGPYANHGLLGLGYAELGRRDGHRQRAESGNGAAQAVATWQALALHDRQEPPVWEALIAAPQALEQMQLYGPALQDYRQAVTIYEQTQAQMRQWITALRGGRMSDVLSDTQSAELPDTRWLDELLSDHVFQELRRDYRDLQLLQGSLISHGHRRDTALMTAMGYATAALSRHAQAYVADAFEHRLALNRRFLMAALIGIARGYEREHEPASRTRRAAPVSAGQTE